MRALAEKTNPSSPAELIAGPPDFTVKVKRPA